MTRPPALSVDRAHLRFDGDAVDHFAQNLRIFAPRTPQTSWRGYIGRVIGPKPFLFWKNYEAEELELLQVYAPRADSDAWALLASFRCVLVAPPAYTTLHDDKIVSDSLEFEAGELVGGYLATGSYVG